MFEAIQIPKRTPEARIRTLQRRKTGQRNERLRILYILVSHLNVFFQHRTFEKLKISSIFVSSQWEFIKQDVSLVTKF